MRWDKGDQIDIWCGSSQEGLKKCVFSTENGGINNAYFTYTGPAMNTRTYFGFYPSSDSGSTTVRVSLPTDGSILQDTPDNSLHLKDYQAMYSDRIEREENNNELTKLQFHHLTSLVILKIHNEQNEPITCRSIQLKTSDGSPIFTSSAVYEAGSGASSASRSTYDSSSTGLRLGENGFTLAPSSMIKCFLPVLPSNSFVNTTLTFTLTTGKKVYTTTFSEDVSKAIGAFKQSTYYIFNLRLSGNQIELMPSGISPWEEGAMGEVTLRPSGKPTR